ncbi:MAG: hypothetical protein BZY79_05335 [SAR202 cluster bacterium Casp-Chloro-G4]|nr:GDSL-type esterase/lipase family protein [Chloroflexota bacterium]MDA1227291.1 GDSL-type esterase/lipase family protein [Chloroflexota bacterium]PKB61172.1 MAG: hypothetical protein BZY79_05335 [SAR202 cluster bacterium Casp-Chloro-G4]
MSQTIDLNDARLSWQGAISLHRTDDGVMPWRVPYESKRLFPPDALLERAAMPAGVRLSFISNTSSLTLDVDVQSEDPQKLDVYADGKLCDSLNATGTRTLRVEDLPTGEKLLELWLPHHGEVRVKSLAIDDGASLSGYDDGRPKWITYGSSISHCRAAESPSTTWPAIAARTLDLNLTCLGYGGNCHLEPMMARMIRDLPADYLSMKVGINVHNSGSMNVRTFRPGIIGFVQILREKHPDTPLAVISPIFSPPRETERNAAEFNLTDMRQEVAQAVDDLKSCGDSNVHYVDGLKLFGTDLGHMLPDDLHPNADGYKLMGANFINEVAKPVFKL